MKVIIANPAKKQVNVNKIPVELFTKGGTTELYSLLFPKSDWSKKNAEEWAKSRSLIGEWRVTGDNYRLLLKLAHGQKTKPAKYRYGSKKSGTVWYHNNKKIIPLFSVYSPNKQKKLKKVASKVKKTSRVDDYVSIKRELKVTPEVKEYIEKNKDTKTRILQNEVRKKFKVRLSSSTIYRIKKGIYSTDSKKILSNPRKKTKNFNKEVNMTNNPFVSMFSHELKRNPSLIEYAMKNPGVALFHGGHPKATVQPYMVAALEQHADVSDISTMLTSAARMNGLRGTIQPTTVKRYLKAIYPSVNDKDQKAINYAMGYRKGTFLTRGAGGRSTTKAKSARASVHKAAKEVKDKYYDKVSKKTDWKSAAEDKALLSKLDAVGKKWVKSIAKRQLKTFRVSNKRITEELPPRKYTKGKRGGRKYGHWAFSSPAPSKAARDAAKLAREAKSKAAKTEALVESFINDYPIDDYNDVGDYVDAMVEAGISGNQLVDGILDFLDDVISGAATLWAGGFIGKGIDKLVGSKLPEASKDNVVRGTSGVITYILGKWLENYADRSLTGTSELVAKEASNAIKVVSAVFAASGLTIGGKPIIGLPGSNPPAQKTGNRVNFEYVVPPTGSVVKEELTPISSVIEEEEIPLESEVGDVILEELEEI